MSRLSLDLLAKQPHLISEEFVARNGKQYLLRPLLSGDVDLLAEFLESLSELTRDRWIVDDYSHVGAQEMCDAIGVYDKLRLVVVDKTAFDRIVALLEFSFAIMPADIERYANYAMTLNEEDSVRFGVCVRDDMHRSGIFSESMRIAKDIARRFGKSSVILWGGVLTDNIPAVKAYEKVGFEKVGEFPDHYEDGRFCYDMVLNL